jgi:hypothetical protein
VLARAVELQSTASGISPEAINEAQLLEIAREVGLSETSIRQALAEERTRIDIGEDSRSWLTRFSGPGTMLAARNVPGDPTSVLASLDAWMQREESLWVQRQLADRMIWEPRRDWMATMRRALNVGGRQYILSHTHSVAATVAPLGDGRVAVRLDANIEPARAKHTMLGAAAGAVGVLSAGAMFTLGVMVHAATLPMLVIAGIPLLASIGGVYGAKRHYQTFAQRVTVALEQVLDRIEHGNAQLPGLQGGLFDALTRGYGR